MKTKGDIAKIKVDKMSHYFNMIDNKIIDYIDKSGNYFVIRMNDKRIFFFKGKKKNAYQEALKKKGKVRMELWFEGEKVEISVSHTKVTLPSNKKDYELVFVY